jgi:uncharacterized protein (UPF0548 family)
MHGELWREPVTYAAIGATQAVDLLQYPPHGYRPLERKARIGHGDARFEYAAAAAMTWGIQRNSGFSVRLTETPRTVTEHTYAPVTFDEQGNPLAPAIEDEAQFGPDGTPFLVPGDTALLRLPLGMRLPVRVIYVVNEPKKVGFAYGTLPGHPEDGEESWIVEQREDSSVWITVRAFSRPANWFWWCGYPILRIVQEVYTRRYLRALAGSVD